jgi:hypothetical protein
VELLLQSWFGGAGALPNTPLGSGKLSLAIRRFRSVPDESMNALHFRELGFK